MLGGGPPPPQAADFQQADTLNQCWLNDSWLNDSWKTYSCSLQLRIGYVVGSGAAPDDGPALIHPWITIWEILPTATVNSGTPRRVIRNMKDHFTLHIYMRSSAYSFTSSSCASFRPQRAGLT